MTIDLLYPHHFLRHVDTVVRPVAFFVEYSDEHLFQGVKLLNFIQAQGGPQIWLQPPTIKKDADKNLKRKDPELGPSGIKPKRFKSFHNKNKTYKGKGKGESSSFRSKGSGNDLK
jgi:hypothetical protein